MYRVPLIPFLLSVLLFALQSNAYQALPQGAAGIGTGPTPETVANWETRLQSEPENVQLRGQLLAHYRAHGPEDKYFQQALWVVQHHPESSYAALSARAGTALAEADYALLKSAWEQALIDQADSGKVLFNAGLFFSPQDPVRAAHLLEQARQLEPQNQAILTIEAQLFASAFTKASSAHMKPADPQTLQGQISGASDPSLLVEVGSDLIRLGESVADSSLKAKGTELINRAISLDPTNEKWKSAAERAAVPPPSTATMGQRGPVHIGAQVAEANLMRKVEPAYPALARPGRISGVIEFTALIGENGRIQNLQLVRGHPLFVNAAREAVLQYVYKPTLLNGSPVPVITSIIVPFELPQQ